MPISPFYLNCQNDYIIIYINAIALTKSSDYHINNPFRLV